MKLYRLIRFWLIVAIALIVGRSGFCAAGLAQQVAVADAAVPALRMAIVPPSPVIEGVTVDLRGALGNATSLHRVWDVALYIDNEQADALLYRGRLEIGAGENRGIYFRWKTNGYAGHHRILLVAQDGSERLQAVQPLEILAANSPSSIRIGGAWVGIYHWSEQEGRLWNHDIKRMQDDQWRELVRAMHEVGMDLVVISEAFRNQAYVGQHDIDKRGYQGRAFYPSRLYPGRMDIAANDPFEAILSEADRLGMHVLVPVGMYAWFDYTPASLAWHKQVATELWQLYGHHTSFYGWYVSEEIAGNLGDSGDRRRELVEFFRQFQQHVRALAPEKPVMLASNAHGVLQGLVYYPQLLQYVDILCTFAFHRMPPGDLSGEEAATMLQKLADDAGAHLWFDLELFVFDSSGALYPRTIEGVIRDLFQYQHFEKVVGYQFPGLMSAPWMSRRIGGAPAVRLFNDYKRFVKQGPNAFRLQHAGRGGSVSLEFAATPPYVGLNGADSLTDGDAGGTDYLDPAWLGYDGGDFVATIDLKQPIRVKQLQVRFLQFVPGGIFLPVRVEFAAGNDLKSLRAIQKVDAKVPLRRPGPLVKVFATKDLDLSARYIRISGISSGPIPTWHPASGRKSWLFADEVLVNPTHNKTESRHANVHRHSSLRPMAGRIRLRGEKN